MGRYSRDLAARDALEGDFRDVAELALRWTTVVLLAAVGVAGVSAWADRGTPEGRTALYWCIPLSVLAAASLGGLLWIRRPIPLYPQEVHREEDLPRLVKAFRQEELAGLVDSLAELGSEEVLDLGIHAASRTLAPVAEGLGYLCQACGREAPLRRTRFYRVFRGDGIQQSECFQGMACRDCTERLAEHFSTIPSSVPGFARPAYFLQTAIYLPAHRWERARGRRLPEPPDHMTLDGPSFERLLPLGGKALEAIAAGRSFPALVAALAEKAEARRCQAAVFLLALLLAVSDNAERAAWRRKREGRKKRGLPPGSQPRR